jgi:hypothetical protein
MAEENIKFSELPSEIQYQIDDFEDLMLEYNQAPSAEGLSELKYMSVQIADDIQDYIESNIESENDDDDDDYEVENKRQSAPSKKSSWRFW